jgi:hypothetical protein
LSPLKDITAHISAIAHCVSLFHPAEHGETLRNEVQDTAQVLIEAVRDLLQTFLPQCANNRSPRSLGQPGEEYLVRTGAVHEIIQNARKGLSMDNLDAMRKKWTLDGGVLDDGLREVGQMIEDQEGDLDCDQVEDGGWEELDLGGLGKKMDSNELERTRKVCL